MPNAIQGDHSNIAYTVFSMMTIWFGPHHSIIIYVNAEKSELAIELVGRWKKIIESGRVFCDCVQYGGYETVRDNKIVCLEGFETSI